MKRRHAVLLALAVLGTPPALAQEISTESIPADGQILFLGGVLDQTCKVKTGDERMQVELPLLGKNSLSEVGTSAGYTPFEIKLENCNIGSEDFLFPYLHFQGQDIDTDTGNLQNIADDNGVQVQLLTEGQPLHLAAPSVEQPLPDYSLGGEITLRYGAQYVATRPATPGAVITTVDYVIAYR